MPLRDRWRPLGLVAACAVPVGAAIALNEALYALVVPALLGAALLIILCRLLIDPEAPTTEYRRILQWTIGGFFAHLAVGFTVTNIPQAVYYLGGDAGTYHTYAQWLLEFGKESLAGGLQAGKEGFYYTLTGLYRVFGPHPVAGLAMNAMLGAALVPIVTDTTRRLFGSDAARWAAPIVVLFPSVFLFTSQLLKEAPILFLFSVALNAAVRTAERITIVSAVMLAGSVMLLLTYRGPIALVGGAGLIAGIALGKREVLSGLTTGFAIVAVLAVTVVFLGFGSGGVRSALETASLEDATRFRTGVAYDSQSAIGADVDTTTTGRALSYLPIALLRFTAGPFPWEVRGLRQLPLLADVLVLWYLLPMAWRGTRVAVGQVGRRIALVAAPAGAVAVVLALSVGNLGILVRERMQVFILVVPLMALGLAVHRNRSSEPAGTPLLPLPAAV